MGMILQADKLLLIGSLLLLISTMATKSTTRFGVPALLLFLGIGILAGSEGIGKINFENYEVAQFIGSIALCFILFSGGLDTQWGDIKPIAWHGFVLSTFGVLLTAASLGVFVYWVTDFTLMEGLLLGAIVSSTDAAAVFSILRTKGMGLKSNLRPLLELESGSNDPMAYFLTISMIFLITNPAMAISSLIMMFLKQMFIGAIAGYVMGILMQKVINFIKLEVDGLYSVLLISMVFATFSITQFLGGNGFLAVYLSAFILGNRDFIHKRSLMKHFDGQAWLMQIVLFLTLGLLVNPSKMIPVMGVGLAIAAFLILVARPIGVFVSLMFFKMKPKKRLFISWVGLRGAVPIVFATYPLTAGLDKAYVIFNIVFFITLTSVVIQGTSIPILARWLKLDAPEPSKKNGLDKQLTRKLQSLMDELLITEDSFCSGKSIVELGIPRNALIVLINRGGSLFTPDGATVIEPGDKLLVIADSPQAMKEVYQCMDIAASHQIPEELKTLQ